MDEQLQKQLIRQLKLLNFWITFFGIGLLAGLVVVGLLLWQVIQFAQNTSSQIQNLQQQTTETFDISQQACRDESLGAFLRNNSDICS